MKSPTNRAANRRRSPRFKAQLRARLLFSVVLSGASFSRRASGRLHLVGYTKDISEIGLALVVPIAEIDERYLAGEGSKMQIELYLPKGAIKITARPVHYKPIDEGSSETVFNEGYLIGAEITKVSDRALFRGYLSTLEEID
ncbi:MAG TPA: PilZ domain-containing protein [Pyrinomonadaceae bacterium]